MKLIRINKYLSEVGYCSRREADVLINARRVTINGAVPEMGTKVAPTDTVCVDGKPVNDIPDQRIYIAYHKPVGVICTTDRRIKDNIIDHVAHPKRVFPIGRLDKPSEGLILLTDDGDIVNKILRANNHHEKEYIVSVDKDITPTFIKRMAGGLPILDTMTNPCTVVPLSARKFKIILTQGLNRQIRRMCEFLNYNVLTLKRIRIMNITLNIPAGTWRDLTAKELRNLNRLLKHSKK